MSRVLAVLTIVLAGLVSGGSAASAAPATGCALAPEPDRPGSGLVGMLDPTYGAGSADSVYGEVGYAGMTWHVYDVCARPDAPTASTDTWVGGILFNAAKAVVAATNGLQQRLGADQLDGLDTLLRSGVGAMYRSVYTAWVGPAVLVLAVVLLWLAARGDVAAQAHRVVVALAALAAGAAVYAAPVSLLKASDTVLFDGMAQLQEGFLGELGAGEPGALAETLTEHVVYANWLRGEFGSADAPQADLGRDLLRAQTFTRAEIAAGADTGETVARKKREFTALAARMGDRFAHFQGVAGSRVGSGGTALVQALTFAAFPAAAQLVVFAGMLVLRLIVLFAPLIAVVAILTPSVLTGLFRLAATVLVNAVLAGALAAAHAWLVVTMLRPGSGVDPVPALVVGGAVSATFWMVVRPVRRLLTTGALIVPGPSATPAPRRGAVDPRRSGDPVELALATRPAPVGAALTHPRHRGAGGGDLSRARRHVGRRIARP